MSENTLLKPMVMGATIVALDKFFMKNDNKGSIHTTPRRMIAS